MLQTLSYFTELLIMQEQSVEIMSEHLISRFKELIGNNLMEVVCDYPDQIRPIIDELVSYLNDNQLDQIEDLIVNNYGEDS